MAEAPTAKEEDFEAYLASLPDPCIWKAQPCSPLPHLPVHLSSIAPISRVGCDLLLRPLAGPGMRRLLAGPVTTQCPPLIPAAAAQAGPHAAKPCTLVVQVVRSARPLSKPLGYRGASNLRRLYEQADMPDRLVVLGDSLCSFNPVRSALLRYMNGTALFKHVGRA